MTILCYCNNCNESGDEGNDTCVLQRGGQCFSAIEEYYFTEEKIYDPIRSFGCISAEDKALLQCKGDLVPSYNLHSIECCNFTDLCNVNLNPVYKPRHVPPSNYFFNDHTNIFATLFSSIVLVCVAFCFYIIYLWFRKPHSFVHDLISSTGSGAGKPLLIQQTISRKIDRLECLGEGRFTTTYICIWDTRKIVEKLFHSGEEERWSHETQFYQITKLRHENILGYIWSDILPNNQRAIYLDYMPYGSLNDYLQTNPSNDDDFWTLVRSVVSGITFLHTRIIASFSRPAVAHRDLNTKNILINSQKQCVISNFEIAITHISSEDKLENIPDITQGTPGFMAPEVVNGTIKADSFEAFKKADIYSLGLVFYQIYQYFSLKCDDDSSDGEFRVKMKVSGILWECLNSNPEVRPNALRIKKTLREMKEHWHSIRCVLK